MLVVDASFLLAILLNEVNEEEKCAAIKFLDSQILIAPQLLQLEIGNALLTNMRREKIDIGLAENALLTFKSMNISFVSHEYIDDLSAILTFSHQHGVTFYVALYLMLALKLKAQLASFDKKMLGVAKTLGITTP